jgi:hypothetical protein
MDLVHAELSLAQFVMTKSLQIEKKAGIRQPSSFFGHVLASGAKQSPY